MIRRQNKKNHICIIFLGVIEFLLIIAAYAANYYTRTRMGMLRHVIYLNGKWEKALPIQRIKWIAICIVIAFAILAYLHYRKEKVNSKINTIVILLNIAISGGTVYFFTGLQHRKESCILYFKYLLYIDSHTSKYFMQLYFLN